MKVEWKVIVGAAFFLGVLLLIYWFPSNHHYEDPGSVMLLFGGCAYLMLGGFLLLQWRRRKNIPRPEDDPEGTFEEGEVDFFPAASIWPAGIGLGSIFVALALIFGNWYFVIGLPLIIGGIIGFTVEAEAPDYHPIVGHGAVAQRDEPVGDPAEPVEQPDPAEPVERA